MLETKINLFEGRREGASEGENWNTELRLKWNIISNNQKNKILEDLWRKGKESTDYILEKKERTVGYFDTENVDDRVY